MDKKILKNKLEMTTWETMVQKRALDKMTKMDSDEIRQKFGFIGVYADFAIQVLFATGSAKQAKAQIAHAALSPDEGNRDVLHFLLAVFCMLGGEKHAAKRNWDRAVQILGKKKWVAQDDDFY